MGWERRRQKLLVQESCYFEWQNLIAEASRQGSEDEEELQWDSYKILDGQLKLEWLESVEQRKTTPRTKGSKRAPKSLEQRRKISEAISRKWSDPVSESIYLRQVSFLVIAMLVLWHLTIDLNFFLLKNSSLVSIFFRIPFFKKEALCCILLVCLSFISLTLVFLASHEELN